ncbi:MAG: hypothetical protein HFH09_03505 [Bacilli bacterium]|jgi:hypothetical protein|nr:hypothetical protein [Bacilli bacterium]
MKNKAVVILKFMTTLVIILIGVVIWLFLNQREEEKKIPVKEPEIKEENLDINSELIKNLPYPNMNTGCNKIDDLGRYDEKQLKIEDIELSEKIDTAYKKLSTSSSNIVSSDDMRQYVKSYWSEIEEYKDFSFSFNDTNYTYDEEEKTYHVEASESTSCEETNYMKRFQPIILTATKKEKQIIVDYVLLYYIEDSSNGKEVVYHIYQDKEFTIYLETVSETQEKLNKSASKYQEKLEHYTFVFNEGQSGNYYFVEGNKKNVVNGLKEVENLEEKLKDVNILTLDNDCIEFTEEHIYQKDKFSIESLNTSDRLLMALSYAYKNELLEKEDQEIDDKMEYSFTKKEIENIYKNFWGEELKSELEEFEKINFKGIIDGDQYRFIVDLEEKFCPTNRKYVETKLEHAYEKEDTLYLDYKIRFIDKKGNRMDIYQSKDYNMPIKKNVGAINIYEEYWDLEYVTYRYVYKKQDDGKYYFLEGLYI